MIRYKINILQALKEEGYTTYRLQKEKLISAGTVQKIRDGDTSLSIEMVNTICDLLHCQPGDLLEWYPAESLD
ncbi:MAG: helix-turn-helix transcriptional regulator [Oscillospiraceae bacterium]|jgi:putative transcriptional regulator|nr:helix-turn-helix transcriptional regulator [Oscillospiraceae bacterium]